MKKILSLIFGGLFALTAAADTARPDTFTAQQPDGTVLTLRMVGDEHFHFFVDVNTGCRMQRAADGSFVTIADQEFVRLQTAAKQRFAEANALRWARMEKHQKMAGITTNPAEMTSSRTKKVGTFNNNLTGQKKGLVILANFSDLSHSLPNPRETWEASFNEVGYNKNDHVGSVHDYFYDQSYGQFDLEFDVVGPVTVSKAMRYYGQNNSYGSDAHAAEMVAEACKLVNNEVNFKDYDWDGDGEVDQVYVIYAGYGESSGAPAETIWPHEYWLEYGYGQKLYLDGVYINTYACSCELRGNNKTGEGKQNGIGTACHEFSHCIGYPDFYDVDYNGAFGMDNWDVMCNGGYNGPTYSCEVPVGYTAYERWMAGWLEPVEITEGCYVEDLPSLQDSPVAYIMRNKAKGTIARPIDEYYLLENRQATKWFSYPAGAHGMLVTHVDYNKAAWTQNMVNTESSHQRMSIVPAAKNFGSYSNKNWYPTSEEYRSMLFPGSKRITEWTDESHAECGGKFFNRNTNGTYALGLPLTEIAEVDGKISFTVKGGTDYGYRWNVSFNAGSGTTTLESWTQKENNEKVVLPEATCDVEGWRFLGWTPRKVGFTMECPAELYAAGEQYRPSTDVVLYAVYGTTEQGPITDDYRLTEGFADGQKCLLLSKNASSTVDVVAVDPTKLTPNSSTKTPEGTVVDVNFDAAAPVVINPARDLVWTVRIEDERIMLTDGNGRYLLLSSAGFNLSDTPSYLGWNTTYGLYGATNTGSSYYVHTNSGKFSVSTTKSKSSRVYIYALADFREKEIVYCTVPGERSGIDDLLVPAAPGTTYDLQGRRAVSPSAHGIVIEGGKKVIR